LSEPRIIAALAYPGVQLLDIIGPLEAFNLASQQLIDDGEREAQSYKVEIIARESAPVRSMSGIRVEAQRSIHEPVSDIDTLLVPGALTGGNAFYEDPDYIGWLTNAALQVRRLCSVCSGALLLAAAGLLDGRRATTHWMDAPFLKQNFPKVRVEANQIYLEDKGVYTSGGITAGIDLALALIEQDHSRRLALKTAKRLLVFLKRPGDQLQFNSFLAAQIHPTKFDVLLDWITEHLDQDLSTASLARRSFMSERTFRRKFEAAIGMSARQYITQARITKAQSLIEKTGLSFTAIALRCGFSSIASMRYAFAAEMEITPREYRQRFGRTME
jgi:transcriptional regulator GlxA family with amidase domain